MRYFIRIFNHLDRWLAVEKGLTITKFPADPLWDLKTENNELSLFECDDDDKLNEIIAGYSSARNNDLENIHFVKLTSTSLKGFDLKREHGDTASTEANELHYNIKYLTAKQLVKLAFIIYQTILHSPNAYRSTTEIFNFIKKAKAKGTLDESKVKLTKKLRASLEIS